MLNLEKATRKFLSSKQRASDFMELFYEVHRSLKQGSGFTWTQVSEILDRVCPEEIENAED